LANIIGFIDNSGKVVVTPRYDITSDSREGMTMVALKGKWGVLNKEGREVVKPKYAAATGYFSEGLAGVKIGFSTDA